jgi:penicillin-binding protein 1A
MHRNSRNGKNLGSLSVAQPYTLKVLRWLLAAMVLTIGGLGLLVAGAWQYLAPEIPDVATLRDVRLQIPLRIYSRDGKLIAQIGEQRRIPLDYKDYPPQVINAFLAAEDDRFFEHNGIDYPGLIRAIAVDVSTGSRREGGGTITMQLMRNMFLSPERSYRRKMLELISAWRIEHAFTKQEILTLYLNKIFLGQRAYGVGAAAEVYFGKSVNELSLAETALLAGLPRAPSRENPVTNPAAAKQRRAYVLRRMSELRFISSADRTAADELPIESQLHGAAVELDAPYVAEMARLELESKYGQRIYTDNFAVYTTVDSRLQDVAQRSVRLALLEYDARHGYRGPIGKVKFDAGSTAAGQDEKYWSKALERFSSVGGLEPAVVLQVSEQSAQAYARRLGPLTLSLSNMKWARPALDANSVGAAPNKVGDVIKPGDVVYVAQQLNGSWRLVQVPAAQGAFVALDPNDGAIAALVGGFDYNASTFNRAVQAKRQPGSSFKPFLYSAALEHGFTPASLINDAPIVVDDGTQQGPWRPQNTNKEFMGPLRLREALVRSRNLVSIRLISNLGTAYATNYIQNFGFTPAELPQNLSLALGATQVAPLEMARGYSVFANGGMRVNPYLVERVTGADGELVYAADPLSACDECSAQTLYDSTETDKATVRVVATPPDDTSNGVGDSSGYANVTADTSGASSSSDASSAEFSSSSSVAAELNPSTLPSYLKLAPRVISAPNAFLMTDMMKDVIRRGTATRALVLNRRDIAGKTGTSNDLRDAWFVGFNADLVGAAWVGFDQERSLGASEEGGRTALPIWIYFMKEALRGAPEHSMTQPAGVVSMRIAPDTGKIATPNTRNVLFEYFMEGHIPDSDTSDATKEINPSEPAGEGLF